MRSAVLLPAMLLAAGLALALAAPKSVMPEYFPLAEPVTYTIKVNKIDNAEVETALTGRDVPASLFLQFSIGTKEGLPVIILNGAGGSSTLRGTAPKDKLPDWAFLKAKDGSKVLEFTFENQLAKDAQGSQVLRISYAGVPVPLVRTLRVARPATFPAFIGNELGAPGPIQLQQGEYQFDDRIQGFNVPVKVVRGAGS